MARETSESSFDELARGLASGNITRGKVLKLMGAALLGGTLTSFGVGGVALADDECKPTGKKCRKNKQCCSGKCEGGKCAAACTSNGTTCTAADECCSGNCVDGQCSACPAGKILRNGLCLQPCEGSYDCPGVCSCFVADISDVSGYCGNARFVGACTTDDNCPAGMFCLGDFCTGPCQE